LPVSKLPSESNQLLDAVLLGDFANGSPEWHELRNEPGVIGGSDIAACAGLSSWTSPITLWAKKTGQIPDEVTPNMSMKLGTILEEPILQLFADEHPELTILTTGTWANKTYPWMRANPDGFTLMPMVSGALLRSSSLGITGQQCHRVIEHKCFGT
jgi:putative phage-type endonuclease